MVDVLVYRGTADRSSESAASGGRTKNVFFPNTALTRQLFTGPLPRSFQDPPTLRVKADVRILVERREGPVRADPQSATIECAFRPGREMREGRDVVLERSGIVQVHLGEVGRRQAGWIAHARYSAEDEGVEECTCASCSASSLYGRWG